MTEPDPPLIYRYDPADATKPLFDDGVHHGWLILHGLTDGRVVARSDQVNLFAWTEPDGHTSLTIRPAEEQTK